MITNSAIYDEQLRQYTISYEGIQFCWDEKPTDANLDTAKLLAVNYHKNIDTIVTFIYNEISDWYGTITIEEVKRRIGTPIIEPERDAVTYCEQTFDDTHNLLYKYIRYRFRRIQIQCNMVYDVTPEEEHEICRNLLKKRAKILIPVGILYCLIFAVSFVWLLGTSEELNPVMQWEVSVIDYVIPIINTIDFKWYAYSLDLLRVAVILAPIAIINVFPYIIFSYIVDTILLRRRVKVLIKEYSTDEKLFG